MARERDFEQYSELALRAATDEKVADTIHKFMWNYAGDPNLVGGIPEIHRVQADGNEYNYDASMEKGFTREGHLVHVRRSIAGSALRRPQTYTYFAVTATAATGEFTEWRINDVRHTKGARGNLISEFVLTTDKFDLHDGLPEFEDADDEIAAELVYREFEQRRQARDAAQARVIMSSDGIWFKPLDSPIEVVYDVNEVIRDWSLINARMAQRAMRAVGAEYTLPIRSVS